MNNANEGLTQISPISITQMPIKFFVLWLSTVLLRWLEIRPVHHANTNPDLPNYVMAIFAFVNWQLNIADHLKKREYWNLNYDVAYL